MHSFVSMYLPPGRRRSVLNTLSWSSEHGKPSVPCTVGALFDVLSLKQPKTLPKYQFVPGIPIVEHSTPLTQRHFDRLKRVHPGARSVDLAFVASSSLKDLHRIRCCRVEQALGGEQDPCEGGQMSVEQSASETAAYVGSSHSRPTTG